MFSSNQIFQLVLLDCRVVGLQICLISRVFFYEDLINNNMKNHTNCNSMRLDAYKKLFVIVTVINFICQAVLNSIAFEDEGLTQNLSC